MDCYDVVVIGGGAAGLTASIRAGGQGYSVLLLEKMEKPARKVRITGKGRCNVTNDCSHDDFLSKVRCNIDFFTPSFMEFDNISVISFFKDNGVELTTERGGRVFPTSNKAWDIADKLVELAKKKGVEIRCNTRVIGILTENKSVCGIETENGKGTARKIACRNIILATGGVSYPLTGSTGDGFYFSNELGHDIEPLRPALVPLEVTENCKRLKDLKLKNIEVKLLIDGTEADREFGEMEFMEWGVSGAVILRLSRDAVDALIEKQRIEISIDLKPALSAQQLNNRIDRELEQLGRANIGKLMSKLMPSQLIDIFAKKAKLNLNKNLTELDNESKNRLISNLKDLRFTVSDYRPFSEAIITAGGIKCEQVNPHTMESKLVRGLYFAGEILDIDADTGGYNLQIAFSTGHLAGKLSGYKK